MCYVLNNIFTDIGILINVDSGVEHNVTQSYKEHYSSTQATSGTTIQLLLMTLFVALSQRAKSGGQNWWHCRQSPLLVSALSLAERKWLSAKPLRPHHVTPSHLYKI